MVFCEGYVFSIGTSSQEVITATFDIVEHGRFIDGNQLVSTTVF